MIQKNNALYGGGIYGCSNIILNNYIQHNSAQLNGGGLFDCNGVISKNVIQFNTAGRYGGGLSLCYGNIVNNIIAGNFVSGDAENYYGGGGGLYSCFGSIFFNTLYGNKVGQGPGAGGLHKCTGTIRNCIVWGNTSSTNMQLSQCSEPSYCCIQNWSDLGEGNISDDPQLIDPDNGNFHLQATSPCVDAGGMVSSVTEDFEGDLRPFNGSPEPRGDGSDYDIGADEFIIICNINTWFLY